MMIVSSCQQLQLLKHIQIKKEDMVVLFQGIKLFIEIEKADTEGCFKITWLMIRHMAQIYSVGGLCTFTCDMITNTCAIRIRVHVCNPPSLFSALYRPDGHTFSASDAHFMPGFNDRYICLRTLNTSTHLVENSQSSALISYVPSLLLLKKLRG